MPTEFGKKLFYFIYFLTQTLLRGFTAMMLLYYTAQSCLTE